MDPSGTTSFHALDKIKNRISRISETFQASRQLGMENASWEQFMSFVENQDKLFHSTVHEGASMGYAMYDKHNYGELNVWKKYMKQFGLKYGGFIRTGLGWTLAKWNEIDYSFLKDHDPLSHWRFFDGWAYHDAIFKKSLIVAQMKRVSNLPSKYFSAYDQGIGRNLWYLSKGEINPLLELTSKFDVDRQEHLWRGIGIAIIYVGAYDQKYFTEVYKASESFKIQFKTGCAMAFNSLKYSESSNQDLESTSKLLFNKSVSEVIKMIEISESNIESDDPYNQWLKKMNEQFSA